MNAEHLSAIYEAGLLPVEERFPEGHRLYQDNDPKHSSKYIKRFLEEKNINWWYTPPESPDLNPIELVWGSMKQFLRSRYKPRNLDELKSGIEEFWLTLTLQVCRKYIQHLYQKLLNSRVHPVDTNYTCSHVFLVHINIRITSKSKVCFITPKSKVRS